MATRRNFIISSVEGAGAVAGIAGHLSAADRSSSAAFVDVSTDTKTIAGEPIDYPSTPNPVISSNVVTIPPGTVTSWMAHPVPAYLYVLEGTLTVEFAADGSLHNSMPAKHSCRRGLTGTEAAMTVQLLSVSLAFS